MKFNLPLTPEMMTSGNMLSGSDFAAIAPSLSPVGAGTGSAVIPEGLENIIASLQKQPQTDKIGALMGNLGAGMDIASGLAQIYLGFQANKMAKKNFNLQRRAYQNNLNDTRSAFNKSLEDQANARFYTQGTPEAAAEYIKRHQLGKGAGA